MVKVAINGFGRIGRSTLRKILEGNSNLQVLAINDLTDTKILAHLFKYDSVYGVYDKSVKATDDGISVDEKQIKVFAEKDPQKLPWKEMGIDIVLESTGIFRDSKGAKKHLEAGAKKVIISAPPKSPEIPMFLLGINEGKYNPKENDIISLASCTTNCLAPVAKVLNDNFKIIHGFMTTCHSYTNDQRILDLAHKDLRRARAAAINIIPTTTGAAKAIGKILPELEGKLDGISFRVPIPTVSIIDFICQVEEKTTAQEVNYALKKASESENFKGILGVEDALLVSSDYIGNSFSSIVDSSLTMAKDNLVKIVAWYDNEWGYASRYAEFAEYVGRQL